MSQTAIAAKLRKVPTRILEAELTITARSSLAFNTKNGSRILEGAPVVHGFIERLKWCWLWRRRWSLQAGYRLLLEAVMPHSLRIRNSRRRGLLALCSCCAFRSARVRPPALHLFMRRGAGGCFGLIIRGCPGN
jgi:hypothetical protein